MTLLDRIRAAPARSKTSSSACSTSRGSSWPVAGGRRAMAVLEKVIAVPFFVVHFGMFTGCKIAFDIRAHLIERARLARAEDAAGLPAGVVKESA